MTIHRAKPESASRGPRSVSRPARVRRALSLLEMMIAVGILGVGLIMVAAVFPVALSEHRENTDRALAFDMVSKAEAMLHQRLDADALWVDPNLIAAGLDSPFHLIPFASLNVAGAWSIGGGALYADAINGAPLGFSAVQLFGTDVLSDRIVPLNDAAAGRVSRRLVWYGFYRQLANGARDFAAAVCTQQRGQTFLEQDLSVTDALRNPTALVGQPMRLPAPWRVTVSRLPGERSLYNASTAAALFALAPPGTKLMIHGQRYADFAPVPAVSAGRILTVAGRGDFDGDGVFDSIEILEDIGDIAANDPNDASDNNFAFDVWLFPPPASGPGAGKRSPLLEWKVSL
ncbi:MAG: hypothetical protein ACE5E1_01860 [Phycisphaerae bacterium]